LGLAITRDLIRLMGGEVEVSTRPGAGATFVLRLPAVPAAQDREVVQAPAAPTRGPVPRPAPDVAAAMSAAGGGGRPAARARAPAPDLTGRRILVVDDVATNRFVAALMLAPTGAEVLEADSVVAALEQLERGPVDLVLLDLHMPGTDGVEGVARLRSMPGPAGRVPVVVMTADQRAEIRHRAAAWGIDGFLVKPIDVNAALAEIGTLLDATPPPRRLEVASSTAASGTAASGTAASGTAASGTVASGMGAPAADRPA
ncbi:MAG: response regulator, partial [Pseudomonadota bacterium]